MGKATAGSSTLAAPHEALETMRDTIDIAIQFASDWPSEYRPRIFDLAMERLGSPRKQQTSHVGQVAETGGVDGAVDRLARELGVTSDALGRAVDVGPGEKVGILGRVNASTNAEMQNLYGAVYCYLKEKAFRQQRVVVEELRQLAIEKACYDKANFRKNFRTGGLLRETPDGTGYVLSQQGLLTAADTLKRLADA